MINIYYIEYTAVIQYALVSFCIANILPALSFILSPKVINLEKSSGYECGFESFGAARKTFDIQFFIVGLLFLIFDLEIVFLIPWAVCLGKIGLFGYWSMMLFLFLLIVGIFFEWQSGVLDWSFDKPYF